MKLMYNYSNKTFDCYKVSFYSCSSEYKDVVDSIKFINIVFSCI